MSLAAEVRVERGGFTLDVAISAADDELVVVLGPNGAGKSTLLAALAGLLPAEGRVEVDGETLLDSGAGIDRLPEDRPVGVVFQDGLLFPHLSLLDNVGFGLRSRGSSRKASRAEARKWLSRVGLADRAGDRPSALSGGQAQLVAMARALATTPQLLLLDEPLSALDAEARPARRAELQRHLRAFGGTTLMITHDPIEALVLADRLVVIEGGRMIQSGTPAEIGRRPRSTYAASVVGLNLWHGCGRDGRFETSSGTHLVAAQPVPDGTAIAVASPAAVALHRQRPEGTPRNVIAGVIAGIEHRGGQARIQLDGDLPLIAEVTGAAVADLGLRVGDTAWASIKASEITTYAG